MHMHICDMLKKKKNIKEYFFPRDQRKRKQQIKKKKKKKKGKGKIKPLIN